MVKKPVLGLAALSLVSFAVSGCWSDSNSLCQDGSCKGPTWSLKEAAAKKQQQQQQLQQQQQGQPTQLPAWNQNNPNALGGAPGGGATTGTTPFGGVQPANFNQGGAPTGSFKPNMGSGVNDSSLRQMGNNLQGAAVDPVPGNNGQLGVLPATNPTGATTARARSPMVVEDLPRPTHDVPPPPMPPVAVGAPMAVHGVPAGQISDLNAPPPPIPTPTRSDMMISDPVQITSPPLPPVPPVGSGRPTLRNSSPSGVEVQPVGGIVQE